MKGPQRDLRARLTDALHGAKTPDVTGRHKGHFQPGTGGPEGPLRLTAAYDCQARAALRSMLWSIPSRKRIGQREQISQ